MQNPFSHAFGTRPNIYVSTLLEESIRENFSYPRPSERCYMLTGVRGSGKTVMMSSIAKSLEETGDWYICNLMMSEDVLNQLAASLSEIPVCSALFLKPKSINFSAAVISAGVEYDKSMVFDISSLITRMVYTISKTGKKLLITLDDIYMCDGMVALAKMFQHLLIDTRDLPVHLIMTGLYQNYRDITDVNDEKLKGCTFLTRTLEKEIPPLDESQIVVSYFNTFDIDEKEAIRLAKMTRGYAFAYQVLGYWYFEKYVNKNEGVKSIEVEYRSELIKYSYGRLWNELSDKDKLILKALTSLKADDKVVKRKDVMDYMNENGESITSSIFNKYRERLLGKGLIATSQNRDGNLWLPLPEFGNYIRLYHMEEYYTS